MEQRERQRETTAGAGGGSPPTGDVARTRQRAQSYLNAADEAINRGLSTDSATFLESTLQEGGE